jgi:hypothetical protein
MDGAHSCRNPLPAFILCQFPPKSTRRLAARALELRPNTSPSSYTMKPAVNLGGTMASLTNALQQLRAERSRAQEHVDKLDQAISVIESLNGTRASRKSTRPTRVVSAASRRKMAQAQKARWARKGSQPAVGAPVKRTMSAAARRKIAAAQKARWAKVRAQKKAA